MKEEVIHLQNINTIQNDLNQNIQVMKHRIQEQSYQIMSLQARNKELMRFISPKKVDKVSEKKQEKIAEIVRNSVESLK